MRNVAKLQGSHIYINEDLCPASQEKKKAQLPLLKKAMSEGKIAYFRHTELIVKERSTQLKAIPSSTENQNEARSDDTVGGLAAGGGGGGLSR